MQFLTGDGLRVKARTRKWQQLEVARMMQTMRTKKTFVEYVASHLKDVAQIVESQEMTVL